MAGYEPTRNTYKRSHQRVPNSSLHELGAAPFEGVCLLASWGSSTIYSGAVMDCLSKGSRGKHSTVAKGRALSSLTKLTGDKFMHQNPVSLGMLTVAHMSCLQTAQAPSYADSRPFSGMFRSQFIEHGRPKKASNFFPAAAARQEMQNERFCL